MVRLHALKIELGRFRFAYGVLRKGPRVASLRQVIGLTGLGDRLGTGIGDRLRRNAQSAPHERFRRQRAESDRAQSPAVSMAMSAGGTCCPEAARATGAL